MLGVSSGGLLSAVQDLLVTPLWMALVWIVHALVVMLEWCFTIDLLDSPATSAGLARGLRQTQAAFTMPWLAFVLAIAAILALYNGLIRRRVAETIGQAALMGVMIVGGTWVVVDPSGTVGALSAWANRASLGTLAVAARGSPSGPARVLGESMDTVFAATIEAPWCYLEFGDVGWCRNPARLDPRLRTAARTIAAAELRLVGCKPSLASPLPCVARGSAPARNVEHSAQLLREAHSNGAIFLALPANGAQRNSINESSSLLHVLCQSSDATNCRGPTAAEAEFRTGGQTMARVGGLLLITVGMLGMVLLLGFVALRLLSAAVFSLLYLLLAPAAVLVPALGESGRMLFRRWLVQLLEAVVAKLLFSFLLGVVLAVLAILANLEALGWWTQWLLMSAFWWGAFLRRHQAIGVADGALGRDHAAQRSIARRVGNALETRRGMAVARWATTRRAARAPAGDGRAASRGVGGGRALPSPSTRLEEQVGRTLDQRRRDADALVSDEPYAQQRSAAARVQLQRIGQQRRLALARGDMRRGLELGQRAERIERRLASEQDALSRARSVLGDGDAGQRSQRERSRDEARFLDRQAALPAAKLARAAAERRDYPALAGLLGRGREEYERLEPGAQRAARLEIDRELAARRELTSAAVRSPEQITARESRTGGGHRAKGTFDGGGERRESSGAQGGRRDRLPVSRPARETGEARSTVMEDVREVAAGRKRQLGRDRP